MPNFIQKTKENIQTFNTYWNKGILVLWLFIGIILVGSVASGLFRSNIPDISDSGKTIISYSNCPISDTNSYIEVSALKTNIDKGEIDLIEDTESGGVKKNEIPAITTPKFISSEEADNCIHANEIVYVVMKDTDIKIYPKSILNIHQIVNDSLGEDNIVVTYSPFSDSYAAYYSEDNIFGVSGRLYKSDTLFFDIETESLWLQLTGEAIIGDMNGESLENLKMIKTTYRKATENFPKAKILSFETGFNFNYSKDPYKYYHDSDSIYGLDKPMPEMKKKVLGIIIDDKQKAYTLNFLAKNDVIDKLGEFEFEIRKDDVFGQYKVVGSREDEDVLIKFVEAYRYTWEGIYPEAEVIDEL